MSEPNSALIKLNENGASSREQDDIDNMLFYPKHSKNLSGRIN